MSNQIRIPKTNIINGRLHLQRSGYGTIAVGATTKCVVEVGCNVDGSKAHGYLSLWKINHYDNQKETELLFRRQSMLCGLLGVTDSPLSDFDKKEAEDTRTFVEEVICMPLEAKILTSHPFLAQKWYPYQENDRIFGGAFYDEKSDAVRHLITGEILVTFKDGQFESPELSEFLIRYENLADIVDRSVTRTQARLYKKKGDDFCKRRLTWLLGDVIAGYENEGQFMTERMEKVG